MTVRQLALLALLPLSACADAQTPTREAAHASSSSESIVVVDGWEDEAPADADWTSWVERPAVRAAIVGAREHWTAQDPGYEEEVRVLSVAEGSFTQPGVSEHAVLYLMGLWPRCCPKVGLAIVDGALGSDPRLVRNVAFEGTVQQARAVPDLDGDGRNELVLVGQFGMGGYTSGSATLVAFGTDGFADRGTVGVYEGGCAAGRAEETATRVLATPGDPPAFTSETYTRTGCGGGAWTLASGPESLSLTPPQESSYVDLPVE